MPVRFRQTRLLIVGCGDIGQRVARLVPPRMQVLALVRSNVRAQALRTLGLRVVMGDLDDPPSLARLAGAATHVLYLAPPAAGDDGDARARALLRALTRRSPPQALVYGSTSGVYGDCQGAWAHETRMPQPQTARARARLAAETHMRTAGRMVGTSVTILRIPGIYAPDRAGGVPASLRQGLPVLAPEDDVFSSRIHADDLARACVLALWRGRPQRVVNVSDDSPMKMGDYFDLVAGLWDLPRPPRIRRSAAMQQMSAGRLSFMNESRRVGNQRLKGELGLRLRWPTPDGGWRS